MKTSKRILSLLLAVIMVASLLPHGVSAATGGASESNVIFAEDFESYTAGVPVKWSPSAYGEVFGYPDFQNTTDVLNELHEADGNKSIKLNATACNSVNGSTRPNNYMVGMIAVGLAPASFEADTEYHLSVKMKADKANSQSFIEVYDLGGSHLINLSQKEQNVGTDWTVVEFTFTMPADITGLGTMRFRIGADINTADANAFMLVDDLQIAKVEDEPEPEPEPEPEVEIFAEDFESHTAGVPVKWSPAVYGEVFGYPDFQNTTDTLNELHTEADGNKSIKLKATACNSVNGSTRPNNYMVGMIAVGLAPASFEADTKYQLSVKMKADKANSQAFIEVYDMAGANGTGLFLTHKEQTVGTDWTVVEYTFTMPADVTGLGTMRFRIGADINTADANAFMLVDDIRIVKGVEEEAPDRDPNEILVEDFEAATGFPVQNPAANVTHDLYWSAGSAEISTSDAHEGSNSAKLMATKHANTGWSLSPWGIGRLKPVIKGSNFEVGATYKVSAWFKASHATGVRAGITVQEEPYGEVFATQIYTDVGTEWVLKEVEFVMSEKMVSKLFNFQIGSSYYLPANTTEETYDDYYLLIDDISIIKVKDAPEEATSITIPENLFVEVGASKTLTATLEPAGATTKIEWKSSDTSVAAVDENGKVTGVKTGTATITATAGSVSDTCLVTVHAKQDTEKKVIYEQDFEGITAPLYEGWTLFEDKPSIDPYYQYADEDVLHEIVAGYNSNKAVKLLATRRNGGLAGNNYCIGRVATMVKADKFEVGVRYKISAYFKANKANTQVYFNIQGQNSTNNGYVTLNFEDKQTIGTEWELREFEFTPASLEGLNHVLFRVGASCYTEGAGAWVMVDNIVVEEVPWVDEIVLSTEDAVMAVDDTLQLTWELKPEGQQAILSFSSSDPSVATVDENGKITARKVGTAVITAVSSIGDAVAKCKVEVLDALIKLESITLDKTALAVTPGWQGKLTAAYAPSDATEKAVVWSSSDASVVTVDENGNVLALKIGTATITAKAPLSGKTAECTVTVAEDPDFASTSLDIEVDFGRSETVDLSQLLEGEYTVLTKSRKGKVELNGSDLKYTSYTWLMEQDGFGFTDAEYTDTVEVAVQNGDKAAIITLNVTIGKLEELFYDENGNWITDVDLMFTEAYLESIKADLKNNPNGERAKIFKYMLERADELLSATTPAYEGRPSNATTEYDADLRYVADATVNFLMAYLLTEDLPGYEAENGVYLQKTIQWAKAGLAYPYWGATHYSLGYGWRNADLPAGHFLFSSAMVYHWLKDELQNETCTYKIGQDGTMSTVVTTENKPMLEALEHRLWYVCEEMYNQTYTFDTYCGNHMHVRMGGLTAATLALRADADTDAKKALLVKYTGLIMYKDGLGMYSLMPDGTSQEGVPYWEYAAEWLIKAGTMIRDNFDIDLFETTHVFKNSASYVIYNLLPRDSWTGSNSVLNIGDSPTSHWYGPGNILRFIAYQYGDANAQWLADVIEESTLENGHSQWMNVMFFDDEIAPKAPTLDHTMHWFQDLDHILARTDWSGNEDMLSFKCGIPFGKNLMQLQKEGIYNGRADAGHAHPDANHITLFANGEFLLRDDGYADKAAGNHNTLLVNGKGQLGEFVGADYVDFLNEWVYFEQDAEPFIKLAASSKEYDYMVGNATEAYSRDLKLDLFERNIVWLKGEQVLLVVDNIKTAAETDLELRWFPESKNVGISGDVYVIQSDRNTMNFYPMTEESTTEFLDVFKADQYARTTEKAFRQTYKGTQWQNAVAFAWNDKGEEVAFVQYLEGENANEHQFGVNGKIYTINVATNEVTVTVGDLEVEDDGSSSNSTLSSVSVNGQPLEGFDPAVKTYTVDRWWKVPEVTVDAYTAAYGAACEIVYGSNVIILTCTSRDGTSTTTYTINITNTQNILDIVAAETDTPREGFDLGWTYDGVITPTNTGNIWANTGLPTIIYDLGGVVTLEDVILAFNISAQRDSYYDLSYSIDGEDWTYLQEDATVKQTSGEENGWHDPVKVVDDAMVNARYIKIKLRAHSQAGKDDTGAYCSIQEITFTGKAPEEQAELFKIDGANMTLGNSLAINFFVEPSDLEEGERYYALITKEYADGRENVVVKVAQADWSWHTGYKQYYVTFNGVAAKEMGDELTVVIYNSKDEAVSEVWVDSVRDYTMRVLRNEEAKTAPNAEKLTLYVDMLNYGAAAQTEFKYNTTDLANNQLTDAQKAYATKDETVTLADNRVKGEGYSATNLTLESDITVNFFFLGTHIPAEHNDYYAVATFVDHYGHEQEVRVEGEDFAQLKNDTDWYVPVKGLVVADCRQLVTVTVYDAEGNAVANGSDSIESYVARNMDKKEIYMAIMKFGVSAYASFH